MGLIKKLSQFLIILSVLVPYNVYAVRFSVDGDARAYPQAVAGLETRDQEVMDFMAVTPMAANFPYLNLIEGTRGPVGFQNYLDISADVLISRAPEAIRRDLRRMYFEGQGVVENNEVWKVTRGQVSRSIVSFNNGKPSFRVEMIEGISTSPTLRRFLRLLAIIEVTNATIAYSHFSGRDYRLYHHVLDLVNQLSAGLLIESLLSVTDHSELQKQITEYKGAETIQAALEELTSRNQIQNRMTEVKREHFRLSFDTIGKWVDRARSIRYQKSQSILGLSSVDEIMDQVVTQDLLDRGETDTFTLLRQARERGDSRMTRLIKKLGSLIINGGSARCDYLFK